MQSIGERLEEARKRKGISLREAAEATKIRSDFLAGIEQNTFDFDLPEIYKRGFLKNYARYLKLDSEKILTDYSAVQLGQSRQTKRGSSELFGKLEVKSADKETQKTESKPSNSYGQISSKPEPVPTRYEREQSDADEGDDNDKVFYMKAGLVCLGTLALVFVIFGLIRAILGGGSDENLETPEIRAESPATTGSTNAPSSTTPSPAPTASNNSAAQGSDQIALAASGTVYVVVQQKNDEQVLYRSTMAAGDRVEIPKNGPVNILFTAGENLTIEHSGERMRPSTSGTAKITIP